MPLIDYLVVIGFAIMVLLAGLSFTRTGTNMKSFFAAGGRLPWWLSGLSLFMSFFSAGTFVVWGSIAYEHGWVAVSIQWMMGISGLLIGFFIAPRWRKANVLTVGSYIGNRFGPSLKKFYSYIFLILSFVTTGAFLYPVAKIFNVSTGFSIEASILILGLLVIAYTAAGGLWAVIVTDVLQFVILFAAVLIVVPLAIQHVGGTQVFLNQSPDQFFDLIAGEYSAGFLFAFLFYNTIFIGGNWAYVQRYTSVSSPQDARKVGWLFGALYFISPVLWMLPAMIYRSVNPDLGGLENEGAFLLMCKEVLPVGLLGLMLGGMIFATASSVNTTLNMSAAVLTNDLYKPLRAGVKNDELMRVARISTIVFGLITIGVALMIPSMGGIVEVVLSVGAITGAPLFAPPIWALFSRRIDRLAILFTTLFSLAINLFFKFISPWLFDISLNRANEMLVGVLVPLGVLALFELIHHLKGSSPTIVAYEMEAYPQAPPGPTSENYFAMRVIGISLAVTGAVIVFLGARADLGRVLSMSIGIGVMLVSWLLWRSSSRRLASKK